MSAPALRCCTFFGYFAAARLTVRSQSARLVPPARLRPLLTRGMKAPWHRHSSTHNWAGSGILSAGEMLVLGPVLAVGFTKLCER